VAALVTALIWRRLRAAALTSYFSARFIFELSARQKTIQLRLGEEQVTQVAVGPKQTSFYQAK
jgi:hypothetical protein